MHKPLHDQVVVITGASSGIGRETALRMADAGASVVVAARNGEALDALVREIEGDGGSAEAVVTDVADAGQVEALGRRAVDRFGRVDTWVNDAAVTVYATFDQLDPAEMEQVIRVNLLGVMFGSKVAISLMRDQRTGTIINVGSVLSDRSVPLQTAYSASKHGVAGFTEALRMELQADHAGIDVVLIQPSSTNTPLFSWARSKMGAHPQPIPPIYEPGAVAEAICHAAEHGGREIVVGGTGKLLTLAQSVAPELLDRYMTAGRLMFRQQRADAPDDPRDNLFQPSTGTGDTTGRFGDGAKPTSLYTRHLELHPIRRRLAFAGALVAAVAVIRYAGR
jgi:short-subunit dehydrogenase